MQPHQESIILQVKFGLHVTVKNKNWKLSSWAKWGYGHTGPEGQQHKITFDYKKNNTVVFKIVLHIANTAI